MEIQKKSFHSSEIELVQHQIMAADILNRFVLELAFRRRSCVVKILLELHMFWFGKGIGFKRYLTLASYEASDS